jgi:hypothetical protein
MEFLSFYSAIVLALASASTAAINTREIAEPTLGDCAAGQLGRHDHHYGPTCLSQPADGHHDNHQFLYLSRTKSCVVYVQRFRAIFFNASLDPDHELELAHLRNNPNNKVFIATTRWCLDYNVWS